MFSLPRSSAFVGSIRRLHRHQPGVRSFSYQQQGSSTSLKSYPQYNVYGENCLLALKILTPQFRVLPSDALVMDGNKKGRILFEWIPRLADGTIARDQQIRFALSPEEVGLLLDQLPENQIELSRRKPPQDGISTDDAPNKVLRVTPGPGGSMTYTVDYELNGISQSPDVGEASGPLEVTAQLGEQKVIEELMRTSIPILTGWATQVEVALKKAVDDAMQGRNAGLRNVPF